MAEQKTSTVQQQASAPVAFNGSYETKQEHPLLGSILQAAIDSYEESASRIAYDMIRDDAVRRKYQAHIKRVSAEVKAQVNSGAISVKEGAEYCNQLRDKLFIEYRKFTSPQGVARAQEIKLNAKGFDFYLNKYAEQQFGRSFLTLSETERGSVYYAVIESAGRDNARVTAKAAKMQALGKSLILFTAVLAVGEIVHAKDKVREVARQGSIIAAGMIGGAGAGAAVSFICGPAEPICAVATVMIGSNLGGMAGQVMFDVYQDELDAFNKLMWH
ncbi:hypothetical protein JOE11_002341 [Robbsia andropogonis]|uniref:hypothetical protein n=1 Tax=Robbsia andropogonis TaxID=28092 RepID=UPI00209CA11C|nr:hypothetical protein [Robbsia andropogonis]MCP1117696.1 hypothetical protein [Robbsia andropogonis]MCP1127162.1 hypothetical protein [Robbsia andropogonis]